MIDRDDDARVRMRTPRGRWVLTATVLGSAMASIDATVVGIALPTIGREFKTTISTLQWVVSGYMLALTALLIFGGSLGDHFGRRRIFTLGVAWFALTSAACAFADSPATLITTRVLQGIGAALLTPGSLAILQVSFHPDDRGSAIGAWSGLGGIASAAGPLLGGYLITAASWRWIFLINLPLGALVMFVTSRHVPESRSSSADRKIDVSGTALGVAALALLTYGLIDGKSQGWTSLAIVVVLVLGIGASCTFVLVEKNVQSPSLPLDIFRSRQFSVTNAVTFIVYGALGSALFLLPVQLQVVDRYSPLGSGMSLLPLTIVMLALSSYSGRYASRNGPRLQMGLGPIVVGIGIALFARTGSTTSYVSGVLPGVLVFGFGLAMTVAPLTATALAAATEDRAGLASAVNNDVARLGSLLAVAVLPALAGITGRSYLRPRELSQHFNVAMVICASLCVAGGIVAALGIANPVRRPGGAVPRDGYFHCALDTSPASPED